MSSFKERLKEILNAIEIEDNGGCGDPECCGSPSFNISHQSKEKALSKIIKLVREMVPIENSKSTINRLWRSKNLLSQKIADRMFGSNSCRQEFLKNIGEGE